MSSLENVSPGMRPLFFSQNIAAKDPEKKIPSTAAKATTLSPGRRKIILFPEISHPVDICKHSSIKYTYFYIYLCQYHNYFAKKQNQQISAMAKGLQRRKYATSTYYSRRVCRYVGMSTSNLVSDIGLLSVLVSGQRRAFPTQKKKSDLSVHHTCL